MRSLLVTTFFLILGVGTAPAQVATGTPPNGSFGGGPFDIVNLGNLNVHFAIPVLNKAGRGTPFSYTLDYDSSVWFPVTSNGITSWTYVSNWGWIGNSPAVGGSVNTHTVQNWPCLGPPLTHVTATLISTFIDPSGTAHGVNIQEDPCNTGNTFQSTAADGSGWTVYYSSDDIWATSRGGTGVYVTPPANYPSVTYIDPNGNEFSRNLQTGQFFDTLSSTTPVLTQAGAQTPTNPTTFTYTAPSGANAVYTVNYTQYTVATNFGVSGTREYGPLSQSLVSSIKLPDTSSYSFTYEKTPGSSCTPLQGTYLNNCITARIASVTLPAGGTITYTYSGGSNGIESDGSASGFTRTLNPGGAWQYARTQVSGSHWQTQISSPPDPVNSGSASDVTLIDFQQDSNSSNFYETQRVVNQGATNALATVVRCYNTNYASCTTTAVSSPITQLDVYSSLPNGKTRASEIKYNGYGLVTGDTEYDYGVTLGMAPSSTYSIEATSISYYAFNNGIVDKQETVIVGGSGAGYFAQYAYDETAITTTSGTPQHVYPLPGSYPYGARGNLTTASIAANPIGDTGLLTQTFTYYDTGNPIVATDVNGAQTTSIYGSGSCGNSFPTAINEPLTLSRSATWNCTGGVATQGIDENGNNITSHYTDPYFWRPANILDQLSNQTNLSYILQSGIENATEASLTFNGGNSISDSRTTVDGFGRPILAQHLQSPGAMNYDTTETDYDNMGRPSRSTMPFVAVAGGTNSTAPGVTTTYDALGRPLTVKDANGGTVSYTYINNDVLQATSGSQTFQKQLEYDGLGRLISVCEITSAAGSGSCGQSNSKTGFLTKYTNDAFGRVLTVTQNAQPGAIGGAQTRTYAYDGLGRLTSEINPETNNLATAYTYDTDSTCGTSNGDLVKRVDAVGNVTCYAYDKFHRVTAMTYPSGTYASSTPTKCYVYDAATVNSVVMTNAKGRLAEAYTGTGTSCPIASKLTDVGMSYSARGEVTDVYESTPHSSGYYHTSASYWPHGSINQLSSNLSGLPTISYGGSGGASGLDGEGRMLQVTASSGQSPVTGVTYTNSGTTEPIGSLTNVTLGSVDSDSFQYDVNTGRPAQFKLNVGTSQSVTGNLGWNSNSTLASLNITDQLYSSNTQSCSYSYDDLNRLGSANCGSSIWSQTYSYDAFGNIAKSVPSGSTGITFMGVYSNSTNRLSSISTYIPTYDNNGNLTYDTNHNLAWDAEGNMLNVDSTTVQLTYDAFDRAVEQNRGGSYTQIVYAPSGGKLALMNGATLIKAFVPLPGGPTAVYAAGTTGPLFYRHADWLGSSRLASTQNRTKYFDVSYAPFGENYNPSGTSDYDFTGQNQDTETGYYDFLFREYSPVQGRWMSPDPSGMAAVDPTNPQSWNRYAYVLNNPLALIDPLGLDWLTDCLSHNRAAVCFDNAMGAGYSLSDLNTMFGGNGAAGVLVPIGFWDCTDGCRFITLYYDGIGGSGSGPLITGGGGGWAANNGTSQTPCSSAGTRLVRGNIRRWDMLRRPRGCSVRESEVCRMRVRLRCSSVGCR